MVNTMSAARPNGNNEAPARGNQRETSTANNSTTRQAESKGAAAAYLAHLLKDGSQEGDSGAELELPSWYDEQLFKRGQSYLRTYRFVIFSGMLAGLIAVLAIPSIVNVLVCTRQSSNAATAYRRYLRTIFHTQSWYDYPVTGAKSQKFWTSIRAVRQAHSRSSHACAKLGAGRITQKDLALTQFGFIGFITVGAHRIQLHDAEFLESTSHMWRVLGYLLGIKDEYNVCGHNWAESKGRLEIVMHEVFGPALEHTNSKFQRMTKALLDGLWYVNTSLSYDAQMYFTKRLAYCHGYEYYKFDYPAGRAVDPTQHDHYYDLGWWDRFVVSYGLFMVTYLHKYIVVRWYLNFRVWLMDVFMYYLPYLAVIKWGFKRAYVRIFAAGRQVAPQEFEYRLKDD